MTWLVAIPAWGERCVGHLVRTVGPAWRLAAEHAGVKAKLIVHTDQPDAVRAAWPGRVQTHKVPRQRSSHYYALSDCNREVIGFAQRGQRVAISNADMVPSIEFFAACERRFAQGKRLIMAAAPRTLSDEPPPIGARSRDLLAWAWGHQHPAITDAIWGKGKTASLATLHFVDGEGNVVTRAFHLQPAAFVKQDEPADFAGLTCDDGLIDLFPREAVHVVTDADELSFAEMSPAEKAFPTHKDVISIGKVAAWASHPKGARPRATASHRWLFTHRICIKGRIDGNGFGDEAVCDMILSMLE